MPGDTPVFLVYHLGMKKILFLVLALAPATLFAFQPEWGQFDFDFDNEKPWKELQAQLPGYPKDENLLPIYVTAIATNKFFIDGNSISVGEDGVVRYTLVVKSPQGAVNVTFEGIRCSTAEYKLYAFGHSDGAWGKARSSKWIEIEHKDRNNQHDVLYNDFFCPNGINVRNAKDAVDALKNGGSPKSLNFGF